jgi:hypothetical protein
MASDKRIVVSMKSDLDLTQEEFDILYVPKIEKAIKKGYWFGLVMFGPIFCFARKFLWEVHRYANVIIYDTPRFGWDLRPEGSGWELKTFDNVRTLTTQLKCDQAKVLQVSPDILKGIREERNSRDWFLVGTGIGGDDEPIRVKITRW